jgi:sugar/nucleoside kinase (ribokinase family)
MSRGSAHAVAVAGNLTTDLILRGLGSLPSWGQEVVADGRASAVAGQAGNLALALAGLGIRTQVVGAVGDDEAGGEIVSTLAEAGVGTDEIRVRAGERTPLSVALVREDGERAFVSDLGGVDPVDWQRVRRVASPDAVEFLCLVGVFNLPGFDASAARQALAAARAAGTRTILDTGWDPGGWPGSTRARIVELLAEVDLFLPNLDEAEMLTGQRDPDRAAAQLATHGPSTVVVKCGSDGSYGFQAGWSGAVRSFPASVRDAVGAGDSFNAGFIAAQLAGLGLRESMEHGNAVASLYISRATNRFPSAAEVEAQLARHRVSPSPDAGVRP